LPPVAAVRRAASPSVSTGRRAGRPASVQRAVQTAVDALNPAPGGADEEAMRVKGTTSNGNVVGVDVEPGYIAAVASKGSGIEIERAVIAPLASGVVREGEVADPDSLGDVLRAAFKEHALPKRVRLGLANQRIVMRILDLPPLDNPKEIASAVRFQAQELIPMPLDQAVLEHQLIGRVETPEGPRSRIAVVAARRETVGALLSAVRKAGLRPVGIDLSAFAMIRALHRPTRTGNTLYVSVGGVTNIAIAAGTTCLFTRVITTGTETMAGELAERRGLTLEHAHGWLEHVGLLMALADVDGDPEIVSEARAVLTDGRRRLVDEIQNSLDFFHMQGETVEVAQAVLTGPALSIPGFADQLGEGIGLPVEHGTVSGARPGALGTIDPRRLAVAAGLTVTEAAS
jgi:type IV pilus assembly protein PilM